jgi:putative redox protein
VYQLLRVVTAVTGYLAQVINTMNMKTTAQWVKAHAFDAANQDGQIVRMDSAIAGGEPASGMTPKQLFLAALCGCSGIDVVDILTKMKVPFTVLNITAEAEQTDEHPRVFKDIAMVYTTDAAPEYLDKVKRAVELSQDKYCGVSAMIKKHTAITYSIQLV